MQLVKANIGDTIWYYLNGGPDMTKGLVVHIIPANSLITAPNPELYVIETSTEIEPIYSTRSGFEISNDPEKKIGFWRR